MCGFFGSMNGKHDLVKTMVSLSHRGPDAEGEYQDNSLYVKHFRLAIIGTDEGGRQPILSKSGKTYLVFNGEIYNFREIAVWLGDPGLANEGDTRVLVELLDRFGLAELDRVNGMFAFVHYEVESQRLSLVRDRYGVKPLYYLIRSGGLYFSSEIKALDSISSSNLSAEKVESYLTDGIYPSRNNTFYDEIFQIEPGTYLTWSNTFYKHHIWYSLETKMISNHDEKLCAEELSYLISDAVRLRLISNVPLSLHFSGGIDSTAILIKMKELWEGSNPLTAFTIKFADSKYDEYELASNICSELEIVSQPVSLELHEIPELALEMHKFQDEPYGGVPTLAYFKMNKIERDMGFKVSLEGQGGDEVFSGYKSHLVMAIYDMHRLNINRQLMNLMLQKNELVLAEVIYDAERLISNGFKAHTDLTDFRSTGKDLGKDYYNLLKSIQLYDFIENKIPRTLRFNDRASMACGREVRFPLLDYRVVEYGLRINNELRFKGGYSKSILREIINCKLVGSMYSKMPKRSLVTPQTNWIFGGLKNWAEERIRILETSDLVEKKHIITGRSLLSGGAMNNSFYIWQLINLSFFVDRGS